MSSSANIITELNPAIKLQNKKQVQCEELRRAIAEIPFPLTTEQLVELKQHLDKLMKQRNHA